MTKQLALFGAGVVVGAIFALAAASGVAADGFFADSATVEAVSAVKSRVVRAYVERDAAALERIYGDDYTAIEADGTVRTKADELASIRKAGRERLVDGRYDLTAVRRFGNVVVAKGRGRLTYKGADGAARESAYDSLNVFEYRDGRWVYVAAFLP